ncbi:hypothetical protein TNCV_2118841 [Trichonephila clavipes]|nr:hypothetical protein TNCV_2118841 [Trichonephila clavipes]
MTTLGSAFTPTFLGHENNLEAESVPESDKIGNVVEEVIYLAKKINLEADSDNVQELIMDELIKMHNQEQNLEQLKSLESAQSEDRMVVDNLKAQTSLQNGISEKSMFSETIDRNSNGPGVDLSRCKDHVVFRIHRIAGSCLRKVVHNFVPEKGTTVDE